MPDSFLNSEEYDERAHVLYDRGDYDAALEVLKEGLRLYPHSVDLYVGIGYTRLAREEFIWALHAFEKAMVLDPEHDDGMVGYGETLLRFGRREETAELFGRVRGGPGGEDSELLMSMARALYRDEQFEAARGFFEAALDAQPDSAEATAGLGFVLHRMGKEKAAIRELRAALALNPDHVEARIYLAHLLYDRGDWQGALEGFAALAPAEHWDPLAVWRLVELHKSVGGLRDDDPEIMVWESRLDDLEETADPVDELLAEIEAMDPEPLAEDEAWGTRSSAAARSETAARHRVRLPDGTAFDGSWLDIVRQIRDQAGRAGESVAQFMRRWAEDTRVRIGVGVPVDDAEGFILAHARAGLLKIER